MPLANTTPSGSVTSTASSASKPPWTPTTPAGSSERRPAPARCGHRRRPPASRPRRRRTRSTACEQGACGRRLHDGADAGGAGHRIGQHAAALGAGDHGAHARPGRDLGGGDLRGHARRCPAPVPGPPATASRLWSIQTISSISDAFESRRGSAGAARGVGEQHEQLGSDQVGDEGRDAVVVAEADLVVGDGVVLVDDGNDPSSSSRGACRGRGGTAGVSTKSSGARSTWPATSRAGERSSYTPHEPTLPHCGHRLQGDGIAGRRRHPSRGPAARRRWPPR